MRERQGRRESIREKDSLYINKVDEESGRRKREMNIVLVFTKWWRC